MQILRAVDCLDVGKLMRSSLAGGLIASRAMAVKIAGKRQLDASCRSDVR